MANNVKVLVYPAKGSVAAKLLMSRGMFWGYGSCLAKPNNKRVIASMLRFV